MQYFEVKVISEETYIVKVEGKDMKEGLSKAEFLAGSQSFSTIIERNEVSKKGKLIKDPFDHSKEKRSPIDKHHGDLFTMKKFKKTVDDGCINDYDGIGYYADKDFEYHQILTVNQLDDRYSHVMWYNK